MTTMPDVHYIARSLHGVEWVIADEVGANFPNASIRLRRREVEFALPYAVERVPLRTADDALLVVGTIPVPGAAVKLDKVSTDVANLDWDRALSRLPNQCAARPLTIDVVASVETKVRLTRFNFESAVGHSLVARLGGRYLRRTAAGREPGEPTVVCRVFVRDEGVLVALSLGVRPMHRRVYKQSVGKGSLHPPLAAAMARMAAPQSGRIVDPFCGDGTIAIEVALLRPMVEVVACDIDPVRVAHTRQNAERAGVHIEALANDAAQLGRSGPFNAILTNLPWGNVVGFAGGLRRSPDKVWDLLDEAITHDGHVLVLVDDHSDGPDRQSPHGWDVELVQQLRVNGRIARLVLAKRDRGTSPTMSASLARWRSKAISTGVVTNDGF